MINELKRHNVLSVATTISLAEMETFVSVVRHGSFTRAAEELATDKGRVSRTVTRLEQRLQARLLERSTRRLRVTEVGREFYERASAVLAAVADTEAAVANHRREPSGLLKLTAGPEFGTLRVDSWIAEYLRRYPNVRVEAEYTNRLVDLIHEGFDVAVRVGMLPDSELSARKLGDVHYGLYAAPDYLERRGVPIGPDDLVDHDVIMFAPRGRSVWSLIAPREAVTVERDPRYRVNNNLSNLAVTLSGAGISLLPAFMAEPSLSDGTLRRVLADWTRPPVPVHAVFTSSRYMDPKVRAFVDLAASRFNNSGP